MHAPRRCLAILLSLAIAGCQILTFEVVDVPSLHSVQDTGREPPVPVTKVQHDSLRDALRLTIGSDTTVHRLTIRRFERERRFDAVPSPFGQNLDEIDNELVWLVMLPIAISLDVVAMIGTFLFVPPISLFADTSSREEREPSDAKEEVRWESYELVDPATDARLTVTQGEELSARDLALLGFRSAELRAVSPGGEQVTVTLPSSAMTYLDEVQRALEQLPADRLVRVAPGESLASALYSARPGSWVQLEAGEYELVGGVVLHGAKLTIAGRGAGRTTIRCKGAIGLDLSGATQQVTLRGLSIAQEHEGPSHGVRSNGGEVRLIGCAVSGARHEKVERTPEEVAKEPGDVYRGGVGVLGEGTGKTSLVSCQLRANMTAGAMATGSHVLSVSTCQVEGGLLETVSLREQSQGTVSHSVLRGPGHGVMVQGTATVSVFGNDIQAARAGILAGQQASLRASDNACHGCGSGISVEDEATATLEANRCFENETGILVSSVGAVQVVKNECRENTVNGISMQDRATPHVNGNTCAENNTGLLCTDDSAGNIENNLLTDNQVGIAVQDRATPRLYQNTAEKNRGVGLFLDGAAAPTVHAMFCRDNEGPGMQVEGQARPDVSYSTFERNGAGLVLLEQAGGRYFNSGFHNNRGPGVSKRSSGAPTFPDSGAFGNQPDWQ